jgi:hypothetical protein
MTMEYNEFYQQLGTDLIFRLQSPVYQFERSVGPGDTLNKSVWWRRSAVPSTGSELDLDSICLT